MNELNRLESTVRAGTGVSREGGVRGSRLAERLGTVDASPDLATLLGTIAELQLSLDRKREQRSEMKRRHMREIEELRPHQTTVADAGRALSRLARGQCCSASALSGFWYGQVRTHPAMTAGYHVRRLVDDLALGRARKEAMLQALIELCDHVDELHHRAEGRW